MNKSGRRRSQIKKRRTTLTLPSDSLTQAERIARARKVTLSTVISEALSEGLRVHAAAQRSEEVLSAYRKAFSGFTDEESSILDGIILEPVTRRWFVIHPAFGPFLFDTSAESWLTRTRHSEVLNWMRAYLSRHQFHVSAVTVVERVRGYSLLWQQAHEERREHIEAARTAYLSALGPIWPLDGAVAVVAGEIMALLPDPPTPPRRSHRLTESRQERLSRWRFDGMIAATALVARMPLIHDNASDFEPVRSAIERSPERFPGLGPLELIRCASLIG
jgi:predicted nucleic acid-binding protein/post-segregation antitoxin (ccd killing protein)